MNVEVAYMLAQAPILTVSFQVQAEGDTPTYKGLLQESSVLVFVVNIDQPRFDGSRVPQDILLVYDIIRRLNKAVSGNALRCLLKLLTMRYKYESKFWEMPFSNVLFAAIAGKSTPGIPLP